MLQEGSDSEPDAVQQRGAVHHAQVGAAGVGAVPLVGREPVQTTETASASEEQAHAQGAPAVREGALGGRPPRGAHGGPRPRAQPRARPRRVGPGSGVTGRHRGAGTGSRAGGSSEKDSLSPGPFGQWGACSPSVGVTGSLAVTPVVTVSVPLPAPSPRCACTAPRSSEARWQAMHFN